MKWKRKYTEEADRAYAELRNLYRRELIYEVYPKSFGTLTKIRDFVPEIAKLGTRFIWLAPIFESPWVDGGYDVSDYCAIKPEFGTLADLKLLIAEAKKFNIGILLDLVPNHTSTEHEWFKKSERREKGYENYYIWRNRPLNWRNVFNNETAWEYSEIRKQYYLHTFAVTQADLNWREEKVFKEFEKIIEYWGNLGIAGFRVDSSGMLIKAMRRGWSPIGTGFFCHNQKDETLEIYRRLFWRKNFPKQGKDGFFLMAESSAIGIKKLQKLTEQAFDCGYTPAIGLIWDQIQKIKFLKPFSYKIMYRTLHKLTNARRIAMCFENHDQPRSPSHYSTNPRALAILMTFYPVNEMVMYQGQELGLKNPKLPKDIDKFSDAMARMQYDDLVKKGKATPERIQFIREHARENARAPFDFDEYKKQDANSESNLNFYRRLLNMWETDPVLRYGNYQKVRITCSTYEFLRIYDVGGSYEVYRVNVNLKSGTAIVRDYYGKVIVSA